MRNRNDHEESETENNILTIPERAEQGIWRKVEQCRADAAQDVEILAIVCSKF